MINKKNTFFFVLLFFITLSFCCNSEDVRPRKHLPGCGISIVPPTGMKIANTGLTIASPDFKSSISFIISDKSALDDPVIRRVWPEKPKKIKVNGKTAKLTFRKRKLHGGGYDGWRLQIAEKGIYLDVLAGTNNEDMQIFKQLKNSVLSTQWDSSVKLDHELAFGIRIEKNDLRVDKRVFGSGLVYTNSREKDVSLMIQSFELQGIEETSCSLAIKHISQNLNPIRPIEIRSIKSKNLNGCETEFVTDNGKMYYAILFGSNGCIVSAMGSAPKYREDKWMRKFSLACQNLEKIDR